MEDIVTVSIASIIRVLLVYFSILFLVRSAKTSDNHIAIYIFWNLRVIARYKNRLKSPINGTSRTEIDVLVFSREIGLSKNRN